MFAVFVWALSVVVLGLSSHWLATTLDGFVDGFYDPFAVLAIATASLAVLSITTMYVVQHDEAQSPSDTCSVFRILVDYFRKGAALNWIIFEISWLSE